MNPDWLDSFMWSNNFTTAEEIRKMFGFDKPEKNKHVYDQDDIRGLPNAGHFVGYVMKEDLVITDAEIREMPTVEFASFSDLMNTIIDEHHNICVVISEDFRHYKYELSTPPPIITGLVMEKFRVQY